MAFKYDKLSYGYHPDFCSTCPANDCHGPCVCSVQPPEKGQICDWCSGTGCPKCGCIPAYQQTFLSHSRVSFPKCTCDMCPKKCPKCCRKRKPCDCLPDDNCNEDTYARVQNHWVAEEEDMSIDSEVSPAYDMEVDEPPILSYNAAGDHMVNFNNSEPVIKCCCECTVRPMDTTASAGKPRQKKLAPKRKRRKPTRRASRRKFPKRKISKRSVIRKRKSKKNAVKASSSETKNATHISWDLETKFAPQEVEKVEQPFDETDTEEIEAPDIPEEQGGWDEKKEVEPDGYDADESEQVNEEHEEILAYEEPEEAVYLPCKVSRGKGPCMPPEEVDINRIKEQDKEVDCSRDCERPCMPENADPCNPRPLCFCNSTCQKEHHMEINGVCRRCDPSILTGEVTKDYCRPCDQQKFKRLKDDDDDKDVCDESEPCEDPCIAIFGSCPPERSCPEPCNSEECENACIIM